VAQAAVPGAQPGLEAVQGFPGGQARDDLRGDLRSAWKRAIGWPTNSSTV
jgi:hypothetical protein